MESALFFLFALLTGSYAQFMSTWGSSSGYSNQMMPMPHTHMPYHHYRESNVENVPLPALASKTDGLKMDGIAPLQIFRARMPNRIGMQDYSLLNVHTPEHEDMNDHLIYRQTMADMKRPLIGVLSFLPATLPLPGSMSSMGSMGSANAMGNKVGNGYQDISAAADDLMTCMGMDLNDQMKVHSAEPRIIVNRVPYMTQTLHKIK